MAQDLGLGGAGALGAAFAGAPRLRAAAYAQERSRLAHAFEAAAAAQKNQSVTALNHARLDAQRSLADTFAHAGMDPAQAELAATAVIAASTSNPNQIIGAGQQLQAQGAGLAGDTQRMNVINSARTGKPLDMIKVQGNTAFNPNVAPGKQDLATTAVGDAIIRARNAQASASQALAEKRHAAPTAATTAGKPPKPPKALSSSELRLLGDVMSSIDANPGALTPKGEQDLALHDLGYSFQDLAARHPLSGAPLVPNAELPLNPDVAGIPWTPGSGPAPGPAEPAGNVSIQLAPGTDPAVAAAVRAAAGANAVRDAGAASGAERSPYPDGTRLRGPGGKIYVVQGGVPVPLS